MCGVAGIISTSSEIDRMASSVEAMRIKLTHRGPDSHGTYFCPSKQAVLTHTRLSIIDLSSAANQPLSNDDSRYTISFNGEIYNYQQLRDQLVTQGYKFNTHSDTEVILHLFAEYGVQCVNHLRGMFAFAIWDQQSKSLFVARDPLGIKPLYFWHNNQTFVFASEIKAIIASGYSQQALDANGVYSYLKTGSVSEPHTLIKDISLLEAGSYINLNISDLKNSDIKPIKYWQIDFSDTQAISCEQAITTTRKALDEAIKAHLVSDVPVGLFLSGGIDSTALLALISANTLTTINTYSIAFEDPQWNEGGIARRVAEHFGSNHSELLMTREMAQQLFNEYCDAIDQPSIDGFNTFCVAKLAHDHNEKVVLSGLGGDELFAGYKSFELLPKMLKTSNSLALFAPIIQLKSKLLNPFLSAKIRRIFDFLNKPNSLIAAHQSLRGIFSNSEAKTLTSFFCNDEYQASPEADKQAPSDIKNAISKLELSTYMRNQLLRDADVMSMHWGLELRVPLVDSVLIDAVASIPSHLRLEQGKKLLIQSVPEIPEWVYQRPKQGFRFPFDEWFEEQWQQRTSETTIPKWIKLKPWYRQWSLVVLNDWIKRYAK